MSIASNPTTEQLVAELHRIDGKAEIVGGGIVHLSPTGRKPGRDSGAVYRRLCMYEKVGHGWGYPDNVAFLVDLPIHKSFAPDAAFSTESPEMDFGQRSPGFVIEARSEGDYGAAAEREMAAKRADYFAARTKVVWDVDLLSAEVVRVYRPDALEQPTIYRKGDVAEAEPAVPGRKFVINELFD